MKTLMYTAVFVLFILLLLLGAFWLENKVLNRYIYTVRLGNTGEVVVCSKLLVVNCGVRLQNCGDGRSFECQKDVEVLEKTENNL